MSRAVTRVISSDLAGNLAFGYIPLDITTARIIAANALLATAEGGIPDTNTAPALARVNGATDKQLRLTWAAASVIEVQFSPVQLPADMNKAAPMKVKLRMGKDANANTVTMAVGAFFNTGDANAGGDTPTIAQAVAEYEVSVAAGDVPDSGGVVNLTLTPSAHAGDALFLESAWIEYTRKS